MVYLSFILGKNNNVDRYSPWLTPVLQMNISDDLIIVLRELWGKSLLVDCKDFSSPNDLPLLQCDQYIQRYFLKSWIIFSTVQFLHILFFYVADSMIKWVQRFLYHYWYRYILISKPREPEMDRRTLKCTLSTGQTFEGVSRIQMLF